MEQTVLEIAYAALLHDIGKFYQRTEAKSTLQEAEKAGLAPLNKKYGYYTHLHGVYTSRFFRNELHMYNRIEKASSGHHLSSSTEMEKIIQQADHIASSIDRSDENKDDDQSHAATKYRFITSRLSSIMSEVDFGKALETSIFPLTSIDQVELPLSDYKSQTKEAAAEEYKQLYKAFVTEVEKDQLLIGEKVTPFKFQRMYALLYKYTTLIPASTYETNRSTVSLFDHLKLTSAIASCLYYSHEKRFYMLEFDVSGIQKFIYEITEGKNNKPQIAKSLRGRSAFISLLTNAITYTILNEFSLTQANIIFNTGGGSVLLLPFLPDTKERIEKICQTMTRQLYERFNTSLTFVYAIEEMDDKELELFKTEKALALKNQLDIAKKQKFVHMVDQDFTFKKMDGNDLCQLCGEHSVDQPDRTCPICQDILKISQFYTSHDSFNIYYRFENTGDSTIDLGFAKIQLSERHDTQFINSDTFIYTDAVNHFEYGNVKPLANLVPKDEYGNVLNLEEIVACLSSSQYGDQKLAILKMDVDNLGAVFAFGLKQGDEQTTVELQRSLSKYLTLSRMMELFFSMILKQLCLQVSQRLQKKYENIFYINYAGGDDLVILGPVFGIVQLTNEIHKRFTDYVRNPNITLSAGIHIQGPKKPVRFGVKLADEALEKSKAYDGKNAITIMDYTLSFDEYGTLLDKVENYRLLVSNGDVSRTSFYHLMTHLHCHSEDEYYVAIPKIEYTLYRQLGEDNPIRLQLVKELTSANTLGEIDKIVLMMKLVILFTREV